jgi:3-deoxy-manno-octulosonate cytidylyltransferase (CMP-KDO synthetase)
MKTAVVIPARYGSTRLPAKPLQDIAGKPLIQWVYESARESKLADEVLIATDDDRIHEACGRFGASAVMTSTECRSGTDRVYEAVKDRGADIVVNLQGDEPQIRGDMIDTLIKTMQDEQLQMGTLCSYITEPHDYKSPHTAKIVMDKDNYALYFSRAPLPFIQGPQTIAIPFYKHIGIYAFSMPFLQTFVSLPKGRLESAESLEQLRVLEAGYRIKCVLVEYDGIGIDTELDLERARKLLA